MLYFVDEECKEVISYLETLRPDFDRQRLIGKIQVSGKGEADAKRNANLRLKNIRHSVIRPPASTTEPYRPRSPSVGQSLPLGAVLASIAEPEPTFKTDDVRGTEPLASIAKRLCATLEKWLASSRKTIKHTAVPREELAEAFVQADYLSTALEDTLGKK